MILWLRTVLFFAGWIALTVTMGVLCLPALLSQHASWKVGGAWCQASLLWLRITCNIKSEIRGREHLPPTGGLIACKHESAWDTLILWRLLGHPAFVLKRELYHIPIFGWYLRRTGHIGIDRRAGRQALLHLTDHAAELTAQGRSLIIFPEGTRVHPGQEAPFHAGVARLSQQLNMKVTPAALNSGLFWPKYTLKKFPGKAIIEFLPPELPFTEPMGLWLAQLQRVINTKTAQLENEA